MIQRLSNQIHCYKYVNSSSIIYNKDIILLRHIII
jgi:hypothetical protein